MPSEKPLVTSGSRPVFSEAPRLARDRERGSSVVAAALSDVLLRDGSIAAAIDRLLASVAMHPELSSLYSLLDLVIRARFEGASDSEWRASFVHDREYRTQSAFRTAETAAMLLAAAGAPQIVVHSQSGTVDGVLASLGKRSLTAEILCAESRPLLEGRSTAETARQLGFAVTLGVDAGIATLMREGAAVLLGCDRMGGRRFRNKIGCRAIVRRAGDFRAPTIVVFTPDKLVDARVPWPGSHMEAPSEVWPDAPAGIAVANIYFEDIPIQSGMVLCIGDLLACGNDWECTSMLPEYHPVTVELIRNALAGGDVYGVAARHCLVG